MIKFVAFDMDGTLVDVTSSWHFVHEHFGESNEEALELFVHDQIDDEEFLKRDLSLWWKHKPDLTVFDLEEVLASVPLMPGCRELFDGLHARRVMTAIISGGIDVLAKRIGRELGVDYVLANGFRTDASGRLTGQGLIRVPIKHKRAVLEQVQAQLGFEVADTASVGNSDIDVGLFERSRIGIAFRPADEPVRRRATHVVPGPDMRPILDLLRPDLPPVVRGPVGQAF